MSSNRDCATSLFTLTVCICTLWNGVRSVAENGRSLICMVLVSSPWGQSCLQVVLCVKSRLYLLWYKLFMFILNQYLLCVDIDVKIRICHLMLVFLNYYYGLVFLYFANICKILLTNKFFVNFFLKKVGCTFFKNVSNQSCHLLLFFFKQIL